MTVGWRVEELSPLVRRLYYRRFVGIILVVISIFLLSFRLRKAAIGIPGKKVVLVTQPLAAIALRRSSVPVAYWCLSAEREWWHLQSNIERSFSILNSRIEVIAARAATWVISLSDRIARLLADAAKVPVHVIPYGVDTELFTPAKRSSSSATMTVLFAGVVREVKGLDVLVEACSMLVGELPVKLLVAGPISPAWRNFAETLKSRARTTGLKLEFPGYVPWTKLSEVMANSDVLVLPSKKEAQGNVILEAMASGIPVVCSRVGGMPELIEKNRCGLVFEANDVNSLASQLRLVLSDGQLRYELGANGRRAALESYSWDAVAELLLRTVSH